MSNPHFNAHSTIDSILLVKASGSINNDIINDLLLENGKDISKLLYEQKENQKSPEQST